MSIWIFWFCNWSKSKTAEMSHVPEDMASDVLQNLEHHNSHKFGGDFFIRNEGSLDYEIIVVRGKFHFGSYTIWFIYD